MAKFMKKMNGVLNASEGTARLSFLKEQVNQNRILLHSLLCRYCCHHSSSSSYYGTGIAIFAEVGDTSLPLRVHTWAPTAVEPLYGIFPLIVGTLLVTIGAMVFAVPLSIGCAIYISELASPRVKKVLKPAS